MPNCARSSRRRPTRWAASSTTRGTSCPSGSTGEAPRTVAPQPKADAFPDYFAFESKLRGHTESVKERQRVYVDDFRDAAPVLDVGCGRGELLALLRDAGVEAR